MDRDRPLGPVDAIVASAGTGKTYTLVQRIADAILAGLDPSRLLATTFTRKAAAELAGRLRAGLIERGRPDLAATLSAARIGTVNHVAGTIVGDFALELGRSPTQQVVDEKQAATLFDQATALVMRTHAGRLDALARPFGKDASVRNGPKHWRDDVQAIVGQARSNGIDASDLHRSAQASLDGLMRLFPEPDPKWTAEQLDADLLAELEGSIDDLTPDVEADLTKGTRGVIGTVRTALRTLARAGTLPWSEWARLAKVSPAKDGVQRFEDVRIAAARHVQHPRLRSDLDAHVRGTFDCAAACMEAYAAYKAERGLLDFVDQEALALRIVRDLAHHERLADAIGQVFVDEVQDSSPLEVALFTALAGVAERSVWVGDPKQTIYAFREADPDLTLRATRRICDASGGASAYLGTSYRTRPSLADFVNAAFGPRFEADGFPRSESDFVGCDRPEPLDFPAPVSVWRVDGKSKLKQARTLARHIAHLLARRDAWPVWQRGRPVRHAQGSDVAVLCPKHARIGELAQALDALGVPVAIERGPLQQRPEVQLASAALRYVADASDDLARAELARLARDDDAWLRATFAEDRSAALHDAVPFAAELDAVATRSGTLAPAEALDAVLHVPALMRIVHGWGEVQERMANLEALRDAAVRYQDTERAARRSVTLAGLCAWLYEDEDARQPASRDPDAVQLHTYHGAKGLQWPIVILTGLEDGPKADPFGLEAVGEEEPDAEDPLHGRLLRYWPWPYGRMKDVEPFVSAASASPEGRKARDVERRERIRLLYVGATRAADHLVLVDPGSDLVRLEELGVAGDEASPFVTFEEDAIRVGDARFLLRPDDAPRTDDGDAGEDSSEHEGTWLAPEPVHAAPAEMPNPVPPRIFTPSDDGSSRPGRVAETVRLGDRIALSGTPDMRTIGEALHRVFAADDPRAPHDRRLATAAATLRRWGADALDPEDALLASDRLAAFLHERYPGASLLHEAPVHAPSGEQWVQGRVDLVVRTPDAFVLVDHKAYPRSLADDPERTDAYYGQAAAYGVAVARATGLPCAATWLHQPLLGTIVRLEAAFDGSRSGCNLRG